MFFNAKNIFFIFHFSPASPLPPDESHAKMTYVVHDLSGSTTPKHPVWSDCGRRWVGVYSDLSRTRVGGGV